MSHEPLSQYRTSGARVRSWRDRGILAALVAGLSSGCASESWQSPYGRNPTSSYQRQRLDELYGLEPAEAAVPESTDLQAEHEAADQEWERLQTASAEGDSEEDGKSRVSRILSSAARLIQQGRYAGTRRILMNAAGESRTDPGLCLALARVNEAMGHWRDAAVWYAAADEAEFAAGISTEGPRWRRQRARCHYRDGAYAAACEAWEITLTPQDRTISMAELTEYADACLRVEEYDTAQLLLNQVSERSSGRIQDVELLRTTCAVRRGDLETAREVIALALDEWPHDPRFRSMAERVVAELEGRDGVDDAEPPNAPTGKEAIVPANAELQDSPEAVEGSSLETQDPDADSGES